MCQPPALPLRKTCSYHARMDGCLFNVSCNAGNKCISVFKISVEIWLEGKRKPSNGGQHHGSRVLQLSSTHLVEQWGRWGLDAGLLVRQRQLFQEVHIGQGILQRHLGRHPGLRPNTKPPVRWGRAWQSLQGGVLRVLLPCAFFLGSWGWQRHLRLSLGPGISLGPHQQGSHNTTAAGHGIGHKGQHTCHGFLPPSHLRAIILEGSPRGSDNPFTELGAGIVPPVLCLSSGGQHSLGWATVLPTNDAFQGLPPGRATRSRWRCTKPVPWLQECRTACTAQ